MPDIFGLLTGKSGAERPGLTQGTFSVGGHSVTFHYEKPAPGKSLGISSEEIVIKRRLQKIARPQLDGFKVKDWGADGEEYTAEIHFFGLTQQQDWANFKAVVNQGQVGVLLLPTEPKAVNAFLESLTVVSDTSDDKVVRAVWVQDNSQTKALAPAPTTGSSASALQSAVGSALSVLQNNPLISGVRAAESVIGTARSAANTVLALDQGVRSRIVQLYANVKGTLNLIAEMANTVNETFNPSQPTSQVGQTSTSIANSQVLQPPTGVDPDTGQLISDFSSPDTAPSQPDPFAQPEPAPQNPVLITGLNTPAGVAAVSGNLQTSIQADSDELVSKCGGLANDVGDAVTAVVNSLQNLVTAVNTSAATTYTVPAEMSLMEVLFYNGIDVLRLYTIHSQNPQIDDPLVIEKGTVVTL